VKISIRIKTVVELIEHVNKQWLFADFPLKGLDNF